MARSNESARACARTHKEFASTLCTVVVEADEAEEALNLIFESRICRHGGLNRLRDESTQLRKIFAKASRTASENERLAEEQKRLEKAARQRARRLAPFRPSRLYAFGRARLLSSSVRVARRFVITGRVQGVGFRYFAHETAAREGLHGWARNLPDRSVEVLVEGEAESVERFERALRHGPRGARVEHVEVEDRVPAGRDTGFSVT